MYYWAAYCLKATDIYIYLVFVSLNFSIILKGKSSLSNFVLLYVEELHPADKLQVLCTSSAFRDQSVGRQFV